MGTFDYQQQTLQILCMLKLTVKSQGQGQGWDSSGLVSVNKSPHIYVLAWFL